MEYGYYDDGIDGVIDIATVRVLDGLGNVGWRVEDYRYDGTIDELLKNTYDRGILVRSVLQRAIEGNVEHVTSYRYADGKLVAMETDDGNDGRIDAVTRYSYDADGRLRTYEADADYHVGDPPQFRVTYMYNTEGELGYEWVDIDGDSSCDFGYRYTWEVGLVRSQNKVDCGGAFIRNVARYTYDDERRLSRYDTYPGDWTDYMYDEHGWVSRESYYEDSSLAITDDYLYDSSGRVTTMTSVGIHYPPNQYRYDLQCPRVSR